MTIIFMLIRWKWVGVDDNGPLLTIRLVKRDILVLILLIMFFRERQSIFSRYKLIIIPNTDDLQRI